MNISQQRNLFTNRLEEYINQLDVKKRNKYTINNDTYKQIVEVLTAKSKNSTPKFKFWTKTNYHILQVGSIDIVCSIKNNRPLVTHEQIYEKVNECHIAVGHSGRDKTWGEVKKNYEGIPLQAVVIYLGMCDVCQTRRAIAKPISGKPIVSVGFLTRLQVDLIDMRSISYDECNFIMHAKDHFTKFSWLFALPSKEASHVARNLRNTFYTFGPPKILQSDNGKEFVAKVILDLKTSWPDLVIINGRPRHPQTQGLVERSNAVVQQMLGKWLDSNNTRDWPSSLGPVMLAMNNCISQSTKKTPYEMVFGQTARSDHEFWQELHKQASTDGVLNEEEIAESLVEQFNLRANVETVHDISNIDDNEPKPVLSKITRLILPSEDDTPAAHKRIRQEAEKNYIATAERQLNKYRRGLKQQKLFQVDDIVGLKIAEVDRSNTSASILPCKIIEVVEKEETSRLLYKVATTKGIIKELFSTNDFIDLTQTVAADLRQLEINSLPIITFIQACQQFTNYNNAQVCKCVGSCETNRCPCKKKNIKCCTKCHRGKSTLCKNQK